MASIYKPTRITKEGKRIKCRYWRIAYIKANGKRASVKGYKDKQATYALASQLERDTERQHAGIKPIQTKSMAEAIDAYCSELARRGSDPDGSHIRDTRAQLRSLQEDCQFGDLRSIDPNMVTNWLSLHASQGMSPSTQNHYLGRLKELLNWSMRHGWIDHNPMIHVQRTKVGRKGRRRLRRAFSRDEIQRIIDIAPEPRKTIYLVAMLSGFRKNELRQMEKQDLLPMGNKPTWQLHGQEKVDKCDLLPMLPECADIITPTWQSCRTPTHRLWGSMPLSRTFRCDLERAAVLPQDERGRWADFHSCRYTFCTLLAEKLPIQMVQKLMRHSSIKLTADLYNDLGIDQMEIVWSLPKLLDHLNHALQ